MITNLLEKLMSKKSFFITINYSYPSMYSEETNSDDGFKKTGGTKK